MKSVVDLKLLEFVQAKIPKLWQGWIQPEVEEGTVCIEGAQSILGSKRDESV